MKNKRYFWCKMPLDFFKKDDIKIIKQQKNGAEYIIFWQELIFRGISSEEIGTLRYKEETPYSPEILSIVTNTNIDIVKGALTLFQKLDMLHIADNGDIILNESIQEMVGSETEVAERVRKHRQRKQIEDNSSINGTNLLHCNIPVTNCNEKNVTKSVTPVTKCNTELELDIELEKEQELKRDSTLNNYSTYNKVCSKNSEKKISKSKIVDNSVDSVDKSSNANPDNNSLKSKKNLWQQILSQMQHQINPSAYHSWLLKTKLIGISETNNTITVKVKDEVAKKKIENEYAFDLTTIAEKITGGLYDFKFII